MGNIKIFLLINQSCGEENILSYIKTLSLLKQLCMIQIWEMLLWLESRGLAAHTETGNKEKQSQSVISWSLLLDSTDSHVQKLVINSLMFTTNSVLVLADLWESVKLWSELDWALSSQGQGETNRWCWGGCGLVQYTWISFRVGWCEFHRGLRSWSADDEAGERR